MNLFDDNDPNPPEEQHVCNVEDRQGQTLKLVKTSGNASKGTFEIRRKGTSSEVTVGRAESFKEAIDKGRAMEGEEE
jgi:hypothetical protein